MRLGSIHCEHAVSTNTRYLQIEHFDMRRRKRKNGSRLLFYRVIRCSILDTIFHSTNEINNNLRNNQSQYFVDWFGKKGPNCMCQLMFNFPSNIFMEIHFIKIDDEEEKKCDWSQGNVTEEGYVFNVRCS